MNKEELVTVIWSKLDGITKDEVRTFLTAMLDSIGHCLANGNNIKLKDFVRRSDVVGSTVSNCSLWNYF